MPTPTEISLTGWRVLFAALLVIMSSGPALAQPTTAGGRPDEETIRRLEKRVSELEEIIKRLVEKKEPLESQGTAGIKGPSGEGKAEDPAAADENGWEEPEVATPAKGRDEEARRRLSELETWHLKEQARKAEAEEEAAGKARIELSGKYKIQYNIRDNLHLNNPTQFWEFDDLDYVDQRFQLGIDAGYGPVSSRLVLDKGNFLFDWKEGSEGTLERWGEFLTASNFFTRELYLQYTGPLTAKVGRQDIDDPHHGLILQGPNDSLRLIYPMGRTPLGWITPEFSYMALAGGFNDFSAFRQTGPPAGDRSSVFGRPNKLDGYYFRINYQPMRWLSFEPYILQVSDRGSFGDPDLNLDKDFDAGTRPRDGKFEPRYLGGALHGQAGNLFFQLDGAWMTGSLSEDRDIEGYAALAKSEYVWKTDRWFGDPFFGLEFARGSGNGTEDPDITGTDNDFNALWVCRDRRKYGNIFSEDLNAGIWIWDSNLANITLGRAVTGFQTSKGWRVELAYARFWTTEEVFEGRGPVRDWSNGRATSAEKTNDVGWEIDLNLLFPIYGHRLYGYVESGYFTPGDVYKLPDGESADPAWEILIGTEFVF